METEITELKEKLAERENELKAAYAAIAELNARAVKRVDDFLAANMRNVTEIQRLKVELDALKARHAN